MAERKTKKKYLPCMYGHALECRPENCSGYHKEGIELPIVDVKGGKIFTHCLVLAMKGVEIEEFDAFKRNTKTAVRTALKIRKGEENG